MTVDDKTHRLSTKQLKSKILEILDSKNFKKEISFLIEMYSAKMITPLFSASYNSSKEIRWHAVSSFGYLAKYLAENDSSKITEIIRRCIWMLTEESGGIPWNAPAIMGEIMANSREAAQVFSSILFSYVDEPEDEPENFLDNLQLRISSYWGIFRLSQILPEFVIENEKIIMQRLEREDNPEALVLLCLTATNIGLSERLTKMKTLSSDARRVELYINEEFKVLSLREVSNFQI